MHSMQIKKQLDGNYEAAQQTPGKQFIDISRVEFSFLFLGTNLAGD